MALKRKVYRYSTPDRQTPISKTVIPVPVIPQSVPQEAAQSSPAIKMSRSPSPSRVLKRTRSLGLFVTQSPRTPCPEPPSSSSSGQQREASRRHDSSAATRSSEAGQSRPSGPKSSSQSYGNGSPDLGFGPEQHGMEPRWAKQPADASQRFPTGPRWGPGANHRKPSSNLRFSSAAEPQSTPQQPARYATKGNPFVCSSPVTPLEANRPKLSGPSQPFIANRPIPTGPRGSSASRRQETLGWGLAPYDQRRAPTTPSWATGADNKTQLSQQRSLSGPRYQASPDQQNRYSMGANPFESPNPVPAAPGWAMGVHNEEQPSHQRSWSGPSYQASPAQTNRYSMGVNPFESPDQVPAAPSRTAGALSNPRSFSGPSHQVSPDERRQYSEGVNPFESLSPAQAPQGKWRGSSNPGRPSGAHEDKKPRTSELDNNNPSGRPLSESNPNKIPVLSRGSKASQRGNSHSSRPSEPTHQAQAHPSPAASQPQTPGSSKSRKRKRNKQSELSKSVEAAGRDSQSSSQQLPEDWARTPGSRSSFPTDWPSSPPAFFSSDVHSAETPTSKFDLKSEYKLSSLDTPGSTRSDAGERTSRPGHIFFDEKNWGDTPADFRFSSGSPYGHTPESAKYSEAAFDRAPASPSVEVISVSSSPGPKTPKTPYTAARKIPSIETADMASAKLKPPRGDERVAVLESQVAALTSELQSVRAQMYQGVVKWWPAGKAGSNGSKPDAQKQQDRSSQVRKSESRLASQEVQHRRRVREDLESRVLRSGEKRNASRGSLEHREGN